MKKKKVNISKKVADELKKVLSDSLMKYKKDREKHRSGVMITVYPYMTDVIAYIDNITKTA